MFDRFPTEPVVEGSHVRPRVPWWLWPQVFSLDAPVVAILWGMALERTHFLRLPPAFWWVLGLATWLIYLVDRVVDSEPGTSPQSARHWFSRQYSGWVWAVILVAGGWLVWLVLARLPVGLLGHGLAVALLVVLYLALFAARQKVWFYRGLIFLALGMALMFVSRLPGVGSGALGWQVGLAGLTVLAFLRLLRQPGRDLGVVAFFKVPLAALLFTLGCSVGVHFWTPPEHGILCLESWLLWGLFTLNMGNIKAAERFHASPGSPVSWETATGAVLLVVVCEWMMKDSAGGQAMVRCVQLSAVFLGLLPLLMRRLSLPLYHVFSDVALALPVGGWLLLSKQSKFFG